MKHMDIFPLTHLNYFIFKHLEIGYGKSFNYRGRLYRSA